MDPKEIEWEGVNGILRPRLESVVGYCAHFTEPSRHTECCKFLIFIVCILLCVTTHGVLIMVP
jgi:hypothetical protein